MTDSTTIVKRLRAVSSTEIATMYDLTREAANLIELLDASISAFMREPKAALRIYVCEQAVNRWKSNNGETAK